MDSAKKQTSRFKGSLSGEFTTTQNKKSFADFKYFSYSRIALKVEYNGDLRKTWNGVEVLLHHSSSKLEFK